MTQELMSIAEAAVLLGIHPETVRVWAREGRVHATKTITGRWRIPRSEVERALGSTDSDGDSSMNQGVASSSVPLLGEAVA